MNAPDLLELIQPYFAARLRSLSYFGTIYVAAPRVWKEGERVDTPKSINERINQSLTGLVETGGRIGAAVRVFQPTLTMDKPGGRVATMSMVSRCQTHPILNYGNRGTRKHVSRIAYEVLRAGHGWSLLQGFCTLRADGLCFEPYVQEENKFETVDIILKAEVGVSPLNMVITPRLTQGPNGTVTLTNITPGAQIYYLAVPASNDGQAELTHVFPGPQSAGATLYLQPFPVPSGTDILYAAYLDGLAGSNVGFQTINY